MWLTRKWWKSVCHSGRNTGCSFLSANSFSMKTKIRVEPSRSRMNQSRPMYGVLSAKSLTGTLWPPSASEMPIRTNAASASQRARPMTMLSSASPPGSTSDQNSSRRIDVDAVRLPQLGRGQVLGKVERDHAEEAQDRQAEGDHAGDHSLARPQRAVRLAQPGQLCRSASWSGRPVGRQAARRWRRIIAPRPPLRPPSASRPRARRGCAGDSSSASPAAAVPASRR